MSERLLRELEHFARIVSHYLVQYVSDTEDDTYERVSEIKQAKESLEDAIYEALKEAPDEAD